MYGASDFLALAVLEPRAATRGTLYCLPLGRGAAAPHPSSVKANNVFLACATATGCTGGVLVLSSLSRGVARLGRCGRAEGGARHRSRHEPSGTGAFGFGNAHGWGAPRMGSSLPQSASTGNWDILILRADTDHNS